MHAASTQQERGMAGKALLSCQRGMGSVGKYKSPNYGVSAVCGVACKGVCATLAPLFRWQQLGSLENGHTLPGQSQLLGYPPHMCVCV